ncbi:polar amino acid transport system substrate-binding protein [Pseudomonas flavescens]|uniref:Polar amino acid transport system substrate-binding protein n=1 Tax=Phytopseudomonas flavescens TaxID=29435 RepID=A0A1G8BFY1_9GAMM|nr:ABC transporter substrate-binding protein [Pseudomonas flavescens]SDH32031.1 polar amino acid transport system substrate-binding protein [Pseudomonas flavescens]
MPQQRIDSRQPIVSDHSQSRQVRYLYSRLCAALLALFSLCCIAEERPIRFSITESGVMPLVDIRHGEAVGGILHDLPMRLAAKIGRPAQLLVMPRLRVQRALLHNEIDVRCYVNPGWLSEDYPGYLWSIPFMMQRDLLVGRSPRPTSPDELPRQSIGTVLGFSYPTLHTLFMTGKLLRNDGRTQGLVLSKLAAGRYEYAISNELALHWYNRQSDDAHTLYEVHELARDMAACLVRDAPDVPTMQLLRAMEEMERDGEFTAILQRYR